MEYSEEAGMEYSEEAEAEDLGEPEMEDMAALPSHQAVRGRAGTGYSTSAHHNGGSWKSDSCREAS